jgi:hypothetical protein
VWDRSPGETAGERVGRARQGEDEDEDQDGRGRRRATRPSSNDDRPRPEGQDPSRAGSFRRGSASLVQRRPSLDGQDEVHVHVFSPDESRPHSRQPRASRSGPLSPQGVDPELRVPPEIDTRVFGSRAQIRFRPDGSPASSECFTWNAVEASWAAALLEVLLDLGDAAP